MKSWAATLSAIVAVSCSSIALAGPVVDAAARAEALQAEGKTVEALAALDEAVDAVWTQSPLAFRSVRLVEQAGEDPVDRPSAAFNPGDTIVVYLEPVGYGYGDAGGKSTIDFGIGLAIENATGQILSEAPDLFSLSRESTLKKRDLGLTIAFKAPALYSADYKAIFTVRDRNSDKTASFDIPFTIAVPGAAASAEAGGAAAAGAMEAAPDAQATPTAGADGVEQPAADSGMDAAIPKQ